MTGALRIDGGELPSTSGVRAPRTRLLTTARPAAQALIRARWDLEIHGADKVPATGPLVMAANHVGWLDGPLLAICAPRPVHALTKQEMFTHGLGAFLIASGQIPLDRFHVDVSAIRVAIKALHDGHAVPGTCPPRAPARPTWRWSPVRRSCRCRSSAPGCREARTARSPHAAAASR